QEAESVTQSYAPLAEIGEVLSRPGRTTVVLDRARWVTIAAWQLPAAKCWRTSWCSGFPSGPRHQKHRTEGYGWFRQSLSPQVGSGWTRVRFSDTPRFVA